MKITVLQENFKSALSHVSKAVPSKPQLAILGSVLLQVQPTQIEIAATDLYMGIRSQVLGTTDSEGSLAVPGKILQEVISSLPAGKLVLEKDGNTLVIQSAAGTTRVQGQASDDYPPFPARSGEEQSLSLDQLSAIDTNLRFSAGIDPTRMVLTGLLFQFNEAGMRVVGTDGFRLAVQQFPQTTTSLATQLLVPSKAIAEVCRIANLEKSDTVSFNLSQELKQLSFLIKDTEVFVRLIEGDYPPFEKIMPNEFATQVSWDGEEFVSQLKRALIFAREASHIVKFNLTETELIIQASSSSFGEYSGSIPIEHHQGPGGVIAFNARYVLDFMTTLKPQRVWFGMNESLKPALFRPDGLTDYTYIVMPFRVNE